MRTVPPPPERVLVFARLPIAGEVKSRLAATLGAERALAVYEALLADAIANVGASTPRTEIEAMWAPTAAANGTLIEAAFGALPAAMQTGEDLTDRLAMAFSERFFFHRTEKIVAVGVDSPELSREMIGHALALLDSCEWVIGPAHDGGYYLIGCRAQAFDVDVFQGIDWGTEKVFRQTLAKIRATQDSLAVLPRLLDIDREEDLRRFASFPNADGALASLLRTWGWIAANDE